MARSKGNTDIWDSIFDDLILDAEPPLKYIKDAIIITKNGARFKVSANDYAEIVARERMVGPEDSDIHSCSLSINFNLIKKDVNKWSEEFITEVEELSIERLAKQAIKKRGRKKTQPKID
jgi:hypothetical protein